MRCVEKVMASEATANLSLDMAIAHMSTANLRRPDIVLAHIAMAESPQSRMAHIATADLSCPYTVIAHIALADHRSLLVALQGLAPCTATLNFLWVLTSVYLVLARAFWHLF